MVGRLPKCIRKNPARWIQKNLRNMNWYSCYELSKTGKFHTFLVSFMILVSYPEWSRSCFAMQYKMFSNITHQAAVREVRPSTAPFFFRACFRKCIVARELFVRSPYFQQYLTDKRRTKLSSLPLQIIFCLGCGKSQSKYKKQF